jgi:hypothetical protein
MTTTFPTITFPTAKKPSEAFSYSIDFAGKYPVGNNVYIVSAALSAIINGTSTDASSTVLNSAFGTIVGDEVWVPVKAGADGTDYKISCLVTLSNGNTVAGLDVIMPVRA